MLPKIIFNFFFQITDMSRLIIVNFLTNIIYRCSIEYMMKFLDELESNPRFWTMERLFISIIAEVAE